MNKQQTVKINGRHYDAQTGLAVDVAEATARRSQHVAAHHVHKKPARARTLSRAHVHAPAAHHAAKQAKPAPVRQSPMVQKFASAHHATHKTTPRPTRVMDVAPVAHPVHLRAAQKKAAHHAAPKAATAQETKHTEIQKALSNAAPAPPAKHTHRAKRRSQRSAQFLSAASASLAVVLLAGYFTYVNLPNLSVRVAAIQAGIDASYPSYHPSGYAINGPVAYADGEVTINFKSTTNPRGFEINQTKSSWDSSALLDNYVNPQSNGQYVSYADSGLTIYAFNKDAAWVSGGILHTIKSDATLTGEQIRKIATSM